jgi:hypothetical protein
MTEQANATGSREAAKDADVDFGGLAIRILGHDAFAEGFQAAHLRLDPAAGVVSGPALPEGSAVMPGGAQGFVAGARGRAIVFPWPPIPADRDDRGGVTGGDGLVAATRVIGAIGGHCADLLIDRVLPEQVRQ